MRFAKLLWGWSGLIVVIVVLSAFSSKGTIGAETEKERSRSDIIIIRTMEQFGEVLQRPPVIFLHDRHTDELLKHNQDCSACHIKEDAGFSLSFKRSEDVDKQSQMDIYHDNCIGCHQDMLDANAKAGPVTCGGCHQKDPRIISRRDPMGFDKSLHYRHQSASDNKCENCHHEYDENSQKTFYAKGKEGTCRYCHKKADGKTGKRFQTASHIGCIGCHQGKINAGNAAGPIRCEGCHDQTAKMSIKTVDPVPRIDRNQPDMILVKRFDPEVKVSSSEYRMNQVPFDHKAHEETQQTCRICHHADLTSCNTCHTLTGIAEGNFIKLEKAMHQPDAGMSCMGCHHKMTANPQCSGCHFMMAKNKEKPEDTCMGCHLADPFSGSEPAYQTPVMGPENIKALLDSRLSSSDVIDFEKIPETVDINALENKYNPVKFPHRKIFQSLADKVKDNRLAGYFHKGTQRMCQGCHHYSPVAQNPPRCGSCHGKPFDENNPHIPGLMGAYHQQCMGCHQQMKIEKPVSTDCTACHEEKPKA